MKLDVFQLRCRFEGRVQGVGFRCQTLQKAKGFEVTGFVKNLPDGRVELYAEGAESEVGDFRKMLESELKDYIRKVEIRTDRGIRTRESFSIEY